MKEMAFDMFPMLKDIHVLGNGYIDVIINNLSNQVWIDMLKHVKKISSKKPFHIIGSHYIF